MRKEKLNIFTENNSIHPLLELIDNINALDPFNYDVDYTIQKNIVTLYFDETEELNEEQVSYIEEVFNISYPIKELCNNQYVYKTQKDLAFLLQKMYNIK